MKIILTEAEAHYHILRGLGLLDENTKLSMHSSGATMLVTCHKVEIVRGITISGASQEDVPDECYRTDPINGEG